MILPVKESQDHAFVIGNYIVLGCDMLMQQCGKRQVVVSLRSQIFPQGYFIARVRIAYQYGSELIGLNFQKLREGYLLSTFAARVNGLIPFISGKFFCENLSNVTHTTNLQTTDNTATLNGGPGGPRITPAIFFMAINGLVLAAMIWRELCR